MGRNQSAWFFGHRDWHSAKNAVLLDGVGRSGTQAALFDGDHTFYICFTQLRTLRLHMHPIYLDGNVLVEAIKFSS